MGSAGAVQIIHASDEHAPVSFAEVLLHEFGLAIRMNRRAIVACPVTVIVPANNEVPDARARKPDENGMCTHGGTS